MEEKQTELSNRIHELRSQLAVIERQKLNLEIGKKTLDEYRDRMNAVSSEISLRLGEEQSKLNYVSEAAQEENLPFGRQLGHGAGHLCVSEVSG